MGRGPNLSIRMPSGSVVALSRKEPMVKPKFSISSWSTQLSHSSASWLEDELAKDRTTESFSVWGGGGGNVGGYGYRREAFGLFAHRWELGVAQDCVFCPLLLGIWIPSVNYSPPWLVATVTLWDMSMMQHTHSYCTGGENV